jgi:hypothetical protein
LCGDRVEQPLFVDKEIEGYLAILEKTIQPKYATQEDLSSMELTIFDKFS